MLLSYGNMSSASSHCSPQLCAFFSCAYASKHELCATAARVEGVENPNMRVVHMCRPSPRAVQYPSTAGIHRKPPLPCRMGFAAWFSLSSATKRLGSTSNYQLSAISPYFYHAKQFKVFHYTEVAQGVNLHINCLPDGTLLFA